ncbi:MAG: hypothetical protein JSR39_02005 [Verrucomicrobia bacterium]|nr:hypothetical protein [Verrucomicrobiota bacterium]
MNPKDRQKMCNQCDGRIPLDAGVCPYCASEQVILQTADEDAQFHRQQSLQESLTALYSPPYSAKTPGYMHSDLKQGSSFMKQADSFKDVAPEKRFHSSAPLGIPSIPPEMQEEQQMTEEKTSFWPILFLSIGANLLMLGLLQLFFSDKGYLRLEWDSSYWFVYCLAALPLVFLGYKKASQLK